MSVIQGPIQRQNFEVIMDQIGAILTTELSNQFAITYDAIFKIPIYKERDVPYNETETPALNICFQHGDFEDYNIKQQNGTYRYSIEATYEGKYTATDRGDAIASAKMKRMLGVCRAILMDTRYNTLGFPMPSIKHRSISMFESGKVIKQDAKSEVWGRLTLVVEAPETGELMTAPMLAGNDTRVQIDLTEQGYQWVGVNP